MSASSGSGEAVAAADTRRAMLDFVRLHCLPADGGRRLWAVPSLDNPRFVVPGESARMTRRSLLSHNALRPFGTRARRVAVALALAGRVAPRAALEPPADAERGASLIEHLAEVLGVADLSFAIGLSRFGPYAKPVLQLFDNDGAVGYAKVGWNGITAELVHTEDRATELVSAARPTSFHAPRRLARTTFRGMPVLITAPLPLSARRIGAADFPPSTAVMSDLATIDAGRGTARVRELELVAEAAATVGHPVVTDAAARVVELVGDVVVPTGFSHGDLVPWNLARHGDDLWIWDWEHARSAVPVGFDLVHGCYQHLTEIDRRPLPTAVRQAVTLVDDGLRGLGLDRDQITAVSLVHRLDLMTYLTRARGSAAPAKRLEALARIIDAGPGAP